VRRRRLARDGDRVRDRAVGSRDGRAGAPHDAVRVELLLVDVLDDEDDAAPPARPPAPGRERPPRRRHPVLWAAVVAVLALAGSAVATRVLESRTVDVSAIEGGLLPVDAPPAERWSVPVERGGGVVVGPGVVVTLGDGLTGYAVDDGTLLWRSDAVADVATCLPHANARAHDVIACLVPVDGPGRVRLVVVDPATGEVVGSRVVEASGRAVMPVGPADVVRAVLDEGDVVVVREDAVTGDVRWEHRLVSDRSRGAGVDDGTAGTRVVLDVDRGVVSVLAPGVAATLTEDGVVLAEGAVWNVVRLPDGRYAGNEYGKGTATVFSASGEREFDMKGRALVAPLSDASVPGVLVVNTFGGVAGVDSATGSTTWVLDGGGARAVLRVDGLLVLRTEATLRAVDVTSGAPAWDLGIPDGGAWTALTDGRSLVVTEAVRGRPRALRAIVLDDGSVLWRRALPEGTYQVFAAEGRLFALGPERLTALS